MSGLFPVLAAALAAAVLYVTLKEQAPVFALFLSLAAALVILLHLGAVLRELLAWLTALQARVDGEAFACLLRAAGILLLMDYTRTLCREAGADSVAWCADLAGRCLVLAAAWPLLRQIYETIWELTG